MADYMAQMLNELMGPQRDALPGEKKEMRYDDPDVCTDFLVDFCTHDIFKNTKNDLGYCKYPIHDENMKTAYQKSDRKGFMGFEQRFLDRIRRIHDDVQRKIKRHEERLVVTQGENKVSQEVFEKKLEELAEKRDYITNKIETLMNEAQSEGEKGNVEAAQSAVDKADRAKKSREELEEEEQKIRTEMERAMNMEENVTAGNRQMQVCQVCGCFMLQNDAPQRIDDHISGKLHIAYQMISETIKRLETEIEENRNRRKQDSNKDERKRDKDREERRKREKESDRERRRSRSRDRERDRREKKDRDRRDHRDRDRHRSHRDSEGSRRNR